MDRQQLWANTILFWALMVSFALGACVSVAWGQEITGPSEAAVREDVWLSLEGDPGTFVAMETDTYKVVSDSKRTAPNAAMFMAYQPGTYTVVAGINGEPGPTYTLFTITVQGEPLPPNSDEAVTPANVEKWLALVPDATRNETIKNPLTGETMTRQQATGVTFTNIGKAGPALGAIAALDQMLSTALVSTWGKSASEWKPFADKVDSALASLQARDVSVVDYADAFLAIGEVLQ